MQGRVGSQVVDTRPRLRRLLAHGCVCPCVVYGLKCGAMTTMTISDIDDRMQARLRAQAALHGHTVEDEARDILRAALSVEPANGDALVAAIRAQIEPLGGIDLVLPERAPMREPPEPGA